MIGCFAHKWNRCAASVVKSLHELCIEGEIHFAQLCFLDADNERRKCIDLALVSTPALLFYWDGQPVTIRRPEWDDDIKCKILKHLHLWLCYSF